MSKFGNTWDVSGAMCKMGDLANEYAKKYNNEEYLYEKGMCLQLLDCITRCVESYEGFELHMLMNRNDKIARLWIEYQGEMIGLPWYPMEGVIK